MKRKETTMDKRKRSGKVGRGMGRGARAAVEAVPPSAPHFDLCGFAGKTPAQIRAEVCDGLERIAREKAEAKEAETQGRVPACPENIQAQFAKLGFEIVNPGGMEGPLEDWFATVTAARYVCERRLRHALGTWEGFVAAEEKMARELNPNAVPLSRKAVEAVVAARLEVLLAEEGKDLGAWVKTAWRWFGGSRKGKRRSYSVKMLQRVEDLVEKGAKVSAAVSTVLQEKYKRDPTPAEVESFRQSYYARRRKPKV